MNSTLYILLGMVIVLFIQISIRFIKKIFRKPIPIIDLKDFRESNAKLINVIKEIHKLENKSLQKINK